jgi:hypothetical protein
VTTELIDLARSARRRRGMGALPGPQPPQPTRLGEVTWLEPYPDDLLEGLADAGPGPEAKYETHEAISLAFITAVQRESRPDAAQANSLLVLTLTGGRIQAMTRFEGRVLPRFGLPPS